ncbi:hypothetical protein [Bacillus licheniformis]|uniref:hypothetical protein n=1 Tax=Bacillus licheniformis TaxID=1402 RepID=UPI001323FCC1|nr:hypothetical protein [Bacillus licheniformis]MED0821616.1 hypothetical protein [Bacillus licheniformis]TWN61847.1 hypothetical protein CHCC14437_3497 [Bacillus licheniformis]
MMFLFIFIIILAAAVLLFINLHPVFGGNPSKEQKKLYQSFDNYADGKLGTPSFRHERIYIASIRIPASQRCFYRENRQGQASCSIERL